MNGGAGDRVPGLILMLVIEYFALLHSSRNINASFSSGNLFEASALRIAFYPFAESILKIAVTRNADSVSKEIISLSLSTSSRTATD